MHLFRKPAAHIAVIGFVASLLVVWPEPAMARMAPETLADREPVRAGPVEPGFPIDYLGVLWDAAGGDDNAAAAGATTPHGEVRFRTGGGWGPWIPLTGDGLEDDGQWASALMPGGGADAYQVRGIPPEAVDPQAVPINTTSGPLVQVGEQAGGAARAIDSAMCRSRADWGADETLRLGADGDAKWPPEFHDTQVMTVHHTVTSNDDPDPEATVRAIYRYHAVDRGWGDIGYHYLIDEAGVVYEGRWSGTTSASCEGAVGADGSDFAHEDGTDRVVTAAHTAGRNAGHLGVALLGEFTDHPSRGADPTPGAVNALEDLLAELALRHGLDPLAKVDYVNPVSGGRATVDTIGGHRDHAGTDCPGERLYGQLPGIRENVATKMAMSRDNAPSVPAAARQ
ncbi:N-acetylmuramoyl-L-alanine amidase [Georgenia sp. AZ-5]|uniref:N-acetylmuramoyl-L-alanine amidase n=1 Tax=Georgenia sp. AZ-5 TaxID=3367526 RepID=UPI003754C2CB